MRIGSVSMHAAFAGLVSATKLLDEAMDDGDAIA